MYTKSITLEEMPDFIGQINGQILPQLLPLLLQPIATDIVTAELCHIYLPFTTSILCPRMDEGKDKNECLKSEWSGAKYDSCV